MKIISSRSGLSTINQLREHFAWLSKDQSMTKIRFKHHVSRFTFHVAALLALCHASAAVTLNENFSTDPSQNGWSIFGDTNLFRWDSTNHNFAVTWDSSQTNSYFYHPLGTTLAMNDDFSLEFDLKLTDATAGSFGSELAVGFLSLTDAISTNFLRTLGTSPNVAEFDYFPPSSIDASVDATLIDASNNFYFGFNNVTLDPGVLYHIRIAHLAGDPGLAGDIFTNGVLYSSLTNTFPSAVGDFQLDAIAVSSYQDDGFGDTILAHGTLDNLVVTLPPLVRHFGGEFTNGVWQTQFNTYANTNYALQRSTNFFSWSDATALVPGNGGVVTLSDTNAITDKAYYRVRVTQP